RHMRAHLDSFDKAHPKFDALKKDAQDLINDAMKPRVAENKELALMFDRAGLSAGQIADKLQVSEVAVKKVTDAVKEAQDAHKKLVAAQKEAAAAAIPLTESQRDAAVANQRLGLSAQDTATILHGRAAAVSTDRRSP